MRHYIGTWVYAYSSSATSPSSKLETTVTIGGVVQTQELADDKTHLAGPNYPMYGIKKNVPKNKNPKFSMSHLSAIIALEIVNNGGGGNIIVRNAQIEAEEEIVGEFKVEIQPDSDPVYTTVNGSKIARLNLTSAVPIEYGRSSIVYLAVKPFDASGTDLKITINGSYRTVTMPENTQFLPGKVTTMRVYVEDLPTIGYSLESNAVNSDFIELSHPNSRAIKVNGEDVNAYILGSDSQTGSVTISGTPLELIDQLPVEFYASSYNNTQGVMRVNSISVVDIIDLDYDVIKSFIQDPSKRQFKALLPLEYIDSNTGNIIILDEEPIHKRIGDDTIEGLLQEKFDATATFEGLYQAVKDPNQIKQKDTPAYVTANAIYNKVNTKIKGMSGIKGAAIKAAWAIVAADGFLKTSAFGLFNNARGIKMTIVLSTVEKGKGETDYNPTDNRVVVWGFNLQADNN